jgi:hypothetical protein
MGWQVSLNWRRGTRLVWLLAALVLGVLPAAAVPPSALAQGGQSVFADAIDSHDCDPNEWHFIINQLDSAGQAPASIRVTWDNGVTLTVVLESVSGNGTAHYYDYRYLNQRVTQATATLPNGWAGRFVLSHGPCGPSATATTPPTATRTHTPVPSVTRTPTRTPTGVPSTATRPPVTATTPPAPTATTPPPPTGTTPPAPTATTPPPPPPTATTPPAPTATIPGDNKTIYAQALLSHDCNASEWHFIINQVDDSHSPPGSIRVKWDNGVTLTIPLTTVSGGAAHYYTTAFLGNTVVEASTSIYKLWTGQFVLSHGPCGPTATNTPAPGTSPSPTPSRTPTVGPSPTNTPGPPTATVPPSPTATIIVPPTNTPIPTPTTPTYVTVRARVDTYPCTTYGAPDGRWVFIIDGLTNPQQAPQSIQVTWDYGGVQTVPLTQVVGGEAQYITVNGAWGVREATALITTPWSGRFFITEGNCKPITPPGDTPELGSLLLFGSGFSGLAGYAYTMAKRRAKLALGGRATDSGGDEDGQAPVA